MCVRVCECLYLHDELVEPLGGLHQVLLSELASALRGLQASADLLHLPVQQGETTFLQAVLLPQGLVLTAVLIHLHLQVLGEGGRGTEDEGGDYNIHLNESGRRGM